MPSLVLDTPSVSSGCFLSCSLCQRSLPSASLRKLQTFHNSKAKWPSIQHINLLPRLFLAVTTLRIIDHEIGSVLALVPNAQEIFQLVSKLGEIFGIAVDLPKSDLLINRASSGESQDKYVNAKFIRNSRELRGQRRRDTCPGSLGAQPGSQELQCG